METPALNVQWWYLIVAWWDSLDPNARLFAWMAGGVVMLALWAWLAYRVLRRVAGHRRLRGAWYNDAQYRELMQLIHEDQQSGRRVLSHEEIAALRKYRYGNTVKDIMQHKGTCYFD